MLQRLITICLIFTLIGSNFSRFFVCAGYEVNKQYIINNLCINKARPELHCNGRCYLAKKLKQAEEKEKKQEREDQKNRYQEALTTRKLSISFKAPVYKITYPQSPIKSPVNRASGIFHPPQVG